MERREEYIQFIQGQMSYFDKKSIKEKRRYIFLSVVALVTNAAVPIVATFSSIPAPYNQIVAALSAVAAVCNGILLVTNSAKNWKHYRDSYTDLEAVLRAYKAGVGDFKGLSEEDAFECFCEKCENVLIADRKSWEAEGQKK